MASRAGKDDGAMGSEDSGGEATEAVPSGGVEAAAVPSDVDDGSGALSSGAVDVDPEERHGRCKWFNVAKGWGFITPDDGGQDVFVHQSVIQMGGFRSLGENEAVVFVAKKSPKGMEAIKVRAPGGGDCHGSARRPPHKGRRHRKLRCYNCGEFSNHIAARCELGPQPKRCHSCRSEGHLVADCPERATTSESEAPQAGETAPSHSPVPETS